LALEEKTVFVAAKKNAFLTIRGSGGRRGSKRGGGKGSGRPLLNTWRQWCDAKGWATIVVEQAAGLQQQQQQQQQHDEDDDDDDAGADDAASASSSDEDGGDPAGATGSTSAPAAAAAVVCVDFATLRRLDARAFADLARRAAADAGARELGVFERGDAEVPFDVLGPAGAPVVAEAIAGEGAMAMDEEAAAAAAAAATAAAVPGRLPLREPRAPAAPASPAGGEQRGAAGESAAAAPPAAAPLSAEPALPDDHPYATSAIWSIPAQPLFFAVEEGGQGAKALAAALAKALCSGGGGAKTKARRKRVFDDDDEA